MKANQQNGPESNKTMKSNRRRRGTKKRQHQNAFSFRRLGFYSILSLIFALAVCNAHTVFSRCWPWVHTPKSDSKEWHQSKLTKNGCYIYSTLLLLLHRPRGLINGQKKSDEICIIAFRLGLSIFPFIRYAWVSSSKWIKKQMKKKNSNLIAANRLQTKQKKKRRKWKKIKQQKNK